MHRGIFIGRAGRSLVGIVAVALLGACSMAGLPTLKPASAKHAVASTATAPKPVHQAEIEEAFEPFAFVEAPEKHASLDGLISKYADVYDVPEALIRRVIKRESGYNPRARNGPYLGLMQIRHETARSMGYSGSASGLLDADTNLKYAVKYLRGAYIVGNFDSDQAMRNYARGYYYDAKRMGLLREAGLIR